MGGITMKNFIKHLFLAASLLVCAPLQAMQEEKKPAFNDLIIENEDSQQEFLYSICVFLTPKDFACLKKTSKVFKKVIDKIESIIYKEEPGFRYFSKHFDGRLFPCLQIYITTKMNSDCTLNRKEIIDFEGAIVIADNIGDETTRNFIVQKFKKKFGDKIRTDFYESMSRFEQRKESRLFANNLNEIIITSNRYLIINPEVSREDAKRLIKILDDNYYEACPEFMMGERNTAKDSVFRIIFKSSCLELLKFIYKNRKNLSANSLDRILSAEKKPTFSPAALYGQLAVVKCMESEHKENEAHRDYFCGLMIGAARACNFAIIDFLSTSQNLLARIPREDLIFDIRSILSNPSYLPIHERQKKEIVEYIKKKFGIEEEPEEEESVFDVCSVQ
jgi:hypothetical protein